MATNTAVIEMQPSGSKSNPSHPSVDQLPLQEPPDTGHTLSGLPEPTPNNAVEAAQKWNNPSINKWRLAAVFISFINFGANDASYGALVPYVHIAPSCLP